MDWVTKGLIGTMPLPIILGLEPPWWQAVSVREPSLVGVESTGGLSAVSLLTDGTAGEAAGTETETGCPVSDSGSRPPKDQ